MKMTNSSKMPNLTSSSEAQMPSSEQNYEPRVSGAESELKLLELLFQVYLPPVLIILGTVSNCLTIFIMKRKNIRQCSISFYITAYACSSLLMLYLFLGTEWITKIFNQKSLDEKADWLCRVWQFISRVISYSGIWFVVAMMIDRFVVIWHPKQFSSLCTIFMAKFVAIIIFVGLVVISIHAMWTFELMHNSGCYPYHRENDIHSLIWPWVAASFYSYIPLALIFIFNVLIFTGICLKRPFKAHQTREHHSLLFTYTTLGTSMFYFLLVMPATIINVVDMTYPPSWLHDYELMIQLTKARFTAHYMAWLNTTIIFFMCLFFSRTFRLELWDMLCSVCCRHRRRIYELQSGSQSTHLNETDSCNETTPL
ncbi:G-protein coupled receptor 183-like [Saccostrea echinata]|uniref:G-protein coupled receptor 183-like n=1 Tax=Saccostrea echinata TaxID=191078 RepID=UPI002A80D170|nr:G-protein coupled receptor 183-like [Saccostrea echinata]